MKAILLVNLKTDEGIIKAQSKFDDSVAPFPSFIESNIDNPKVVKLIEVVEVPKALAKKAEALKVAEESKAAEESKDAASAPKLNKSKLNKK